MKLSQAIEKAIVSKTYAPYVNEFMCNIMNVQGMQHHTESIQDMVATIYPEGNRSQPLICALIDAGIREAEYDNDLEDFAYTKELYCWWVFDLKRKGL